jgi:hypothetical protein
VKNVEGDDKCFFYFLSVFDSSELGLREVVGFLEWYVVAV